jgi:Protein of unknown function (DUF2851)
MATLKEDFYASWRSAIRPEPVIEDGATVPERWLQQIWRHQRIRRSELATVDGQSLQILHPGFWNREAGPDFKGAVIRRAGGVAETGDVEIDRAIGGWRGHGHAQNPNYQKVILHVVWEAPLGGSERPTLALRPILDTSLAEMATWLEEAGGLLPESVPGQCCGALSGVSADAVEELLQQAAWVRFRRKAEELAVRARQTGWDAALLESLFGGLGYKHNVWPMRRLAEVIFPPSPGTGLQDAGASISGDIILGMEARLLGLSGLLPGDIRERRDSEYLRGLWDVWWQERDRWMEHQLPPSIWRMNGLRPANHPHRRIALAARWVAAGDIPARCTAWLLAGTGAPNPVEFGPSGLHRMLGFLDEPPSYWSHHWTLVSARQFRPSPLLGEGRLTDLAVNSVLPWLFARASTGRNEALEAEIRRRYLSWPASEDNAALKQARGRLFGAVRPRLAKRACIQQGMLQITRDFCAAAGALCTGCRFPDVVASVRRAGSGGPG